MWPSFSRLSSSWLIFVVLAVVSANDDATDDPNDPCSSHALNAYRECILDNPCTCRNCHPDPSDPDWVIEAQEPRSCQDISRIFCPLVRCCTPCESVFSFYHSCLADQIASIYFGQDHTCPLFICANDADDFEGECTPTQAPSPEPNPCESEVSSYLSCVAGQTECSSCIPAEVTQLHLSSNTRSCQAMNRDVFCPLEKCCPSCKLDALASCVETNLVAANDDCPNTFCAPTDAPALAPASPQPTLAPNPVIPAATTTSAATTRSRGVLLGAAGFLAFSCFCLL